MMAQWYVKELSKLTGVSVQTLHHYDKINLLTPSVRHANGYRLYSERDLLLLQQIIALKFFGFTLAQIKVLLAGNASMQDHFAAQASFLEEKSKSLQEASQTLKSVIQTCNTDGSIPWKDIITLIEAYKMTQQLEKTWAGKVLTSDELTQYAKFESSLKTRFSEKDKKSFEQAWANLVEKMRCHLSTDPGSPIGQAIAKESMDMINRLYGAEHANLKVSIWEKGFKKGKMDGEHALSPDIVAWLDKATQAYYQARIYTLLATIEQPDSQSAWMALMQELFGGAVDLEHIAIDQALADPKVSATAKTWLRTLL